MKNHKLKFNSQIKTKLENSGWSGMTSIMTTACHANKFWRKIRQGEFDTCLADAHETAEIKSDSSPIDWVPHITACTQNKDWGRMQGPLTNSQRHKISALITVLSLLTPSQSEMEEGIQRGRKVSQAGKFSQQHLLLRWLIASIKCSIMVLPHVDKWRNLIKSRKQGLCWLGADFYEEYKWGNHSVRVPQL